MSANDDLLDILRDALTSVGVVTGRRMFGGIGCPLILSGGTG